jgi:thiamine kinase-like enzyme
MDFLKDGIETLRKLSEPFADQTEISELIDHSLEKMKNDANEASDAFLENKFTLIHFDLNPDNIIYSKKNNDLAIIDWEQASAGDNAMDIAKLFLKSNFNSGQKQEFLSQYEKYLVNKDPKFEERLRIYEPFVLINSILWKLRVLRNTPQHAASISETQFYERVKNNLERELIVLRDFLDNKKI